ncbi:MAG: hypothetical protein WA876_15695 [Candidatus Acidiferrales bacterium]
MTVAPSIKMKRLCIERGFGIENAEISRELGSDAGGNASMEQ